MSGAEPGRILIVDDDEAARYVKSHLLRRQGYVVSEASLGRDALALAAFAQRSTFTTETVRVTDLLAVSEGFLRPAAGEAIEVAFAGASDLWHCPGRSSSARGRHPQPRPLPSRRSAWKASARGCHLVSCFPDGRQPQGEVRAADHAKARPDKQGKGARFRGGRAKNLG